MADPIGAAAALVLWVALLPSAPRAQVGNIDFVRGLAAATPDLPAFPATPKTLGFFSSLPGSLFAPDGAAPFPAIVLHHTCGGVSEQARHWVKAGLARGYAVLVLDSLGPRGIRSVCDLRPHQGTVNLGRGAKDATDALDHLAQLPFIDAERIVFVGHSWGAMAGLWVASGSVGTLHTARRFRAIASFYPFCGPFLRHDIDRPLLVLMGSLDNETPPDRCVPGLESNKARGNPVEWEIYEGATHAWDTDRDLVRTTNMGISVRYSYNRQVVDASTTRLFGFLEAHLSRAEAAKSR